MDTLHNKFPIGSEIITPTGWLGIVVKHEAIKNPVFGHMVYYITCKSLKDGKRLRFNDFDDLTIRIHNN